MYSGIIGVIGGVESALHGLCFYGRDEAREEDRGGAMKRAGRGRERTGKTDSQAHAGTHRNGEKKTISQTEKQGNFTLS